MSKEKYKLLRDSFELAILFVPLIYLSEWVETLYPFDTSVHYMLAANLLPFISVFLSFCVLVSENTSITLKKWICSIPCTILMWAFFYFTKFSLRWTNTRYPGYGLESAGGGFAFLYTIKIFCLASIMALFLALVLSLCLGSNLAKVRSVLQDKILPAICVFIMLIVIFFELTMTPWDTIQLSLQG